MDNNTFFQAIWRFNAVAFAIGAVLVIFLALNAVSDIAGRMLWREASDVAAPSSSTTGESDAATLHLTLGGFSSLRREKILWAPVYGAQTFQYRIRSKTASSVRNYVFLDAKTGSTWELLPNNRTLIAHTDVIRTKDADASERSRAVVVGLVEADTNADGRLTSNDKMAIAVAGTEGRNLVRLPFHGRLLSAQSVDQQTGLLVFEAAKDDVQAVTIDLDSFEVTKRFPVWSASR